MPSDSKQAKRHRERQGKPHMARVYSPPPGAVFRAKRHDLYALFIVCPRSGAIWNLDKWEARYGTAPGAAKAAHRARAALGLA